MIVDVQPLYGLSALIVFIIAFVLGDHFSGLYVSALESTPIYAA